MRTIVTLMVASALAACGGQGADRGDDTTDTAGGEETAVTGPECSFGGTWSGAFVGGPNEGSTVTWAFGEGGAVHTEFVDLAFDGEWSIDGDVVSVTDTSETPCTGVTGQFRVTFAEGNCDEVTVTSVADECIPRRSSTDGMTLNRQ